MIKDFFEAFADIMRMFLPIIGGIACIILIALVLSNSNPEIDMDFVINECEVCYEEWQYDLIVDAYESEGYIVCYDYNSKDIYATVTFQVPSEYIMPSLLFAYNKADKDWDTIVHYWNDPDTF